MPFASALSEHPVASQATGEVTGAVLEALGERPDLVTLCVTRPHAGALEDIVATVSEILHPLAIIGGSSGGVVGTGREVEETPSIALWAARLGPLAPVSLHATRLADDSWHFSGWPDAIGFMPSALVLLADPFTFPSDEFLTWLHIAHPGLAVIGGDVSGALGPGGARLLAGNAVSTSGATGILIGPGVAVSTVTAQGCLPYGNVLTVTRADRNVIYEIAGVPAIECLVDQIRGHVQPFDVAAIESHGLFIGRLIDERADDPGPEDYLIRRVVGVDRDSGAVAVDDRIPLGAAIRFHRSDPEGAHDEFEQLLTGREADAALMFLGRSRGSRLFDVVDHDATAVAESIGSVPLSGVMGDGVIGPIGGRNFVHGAAATLALFQDR